MIYTYNCFRVYPKHTIIIIFINLDFFLYFAEQLTISLAENKICEAENYNILLKMDEYRSEMKNAQTNLEMERAWKEKWKEKVLNKALKETESSFNNCVESKDYTKASECQFH